MGYMNTREVLNLFPPLQRYLFFYINIFCIFAFFQDLYLLFDMLNHEGNTLLSFTDPILSLGSLQLCAITMKNMLLFTFFLFPLHFFFFCNTPYGANLVRQECHPDLGSQMIHSTLIYLWK